MSNKDATATEPEFLAGAKRPWSQALVDTVETPDDITTNKNYVSDSGILLDLVDVESDVASEARRVADVCTRMEGLAHEAADALVTLDALDQTLPRAQRLALLLDPMRTLGKRAIVECEERSVQLDNVLERLVDLIETHKNPHHPHPTRPTRPAHQLIREARQLIHDPLLLVSEAFMKLESFSHFAQVIVKGDSFELDRGLAAAASAVNMHNLSLYLADGRADSSSCDLKVCVAAARAGYTNILHVFTKNTKIATSIAAVATLMVLEPPALRQEMFESLALSPCATRLSDTDICALIASGLVYSGTCSDAVLMATVKCGDFLQLEALLADPRLDTSCRGLTAAVAFACQGLQSTTCTAVLGALLRGGRSYPAIDACWILDAAIMAGNVGAVEFMLSDKSLAFTEALKTRFLASVYDNRPYTGDHRIEMEMINLLLQDGRVDPGSYEHDIFGDAVFHGHAQAVIALLADSRVDPCKERPILNETPFASAVDHEYVDIVRILLADGRVDPSAENNRALDIANSTGHVGIITMLLADERVKQAMRVP